MKILLITFEYPLGKSYCGGVGQVVKQCRDALLNEGHSVYVLISAGFRKKDPVRLILPDNSFICYPGLLSFHKAYEWGRFDCVIQHFVNWTKELKKVKALKRGPKVFYHFHSILRRERDSGFKTFNKFLLNQERMIEIADKIICPSRYEYDNFSRYFPYFSEKVVLVENNVESFPVDQDRLQSLRDAYGIKKDDIVSVYVGRLERIKGAHILIEHLPKMLGNHKNLKVFMIGRVLDAEMHKRLKAVQKKFSKQLFYIRYLEKSLLFQYYYLSSIYINASLSESFSLSTHESALCNNALLLSRLPVFDKFKDAAVFFSGSDGNGDGFVSRYESLIRDRALRERLSRRAAKISRSFLLKDSLQQDLARLFK